MMWRKNISGGWAIRDKDRKTPAIGNPVLVETTVEEGLINRFPTVQQHQAHLARRPVGAPPKISTNANYNKDLPPVEIRGERRSRIPRPLTEFTTTSSISTRATPEARHDFDPASRVAPLFSSDAHEFASPRRSFTDPSPQVQVGSSQANHEPPKTQLTFGERLQQAYRGGLGIETAQRRQWLGASGETQPMTPIASTLGANTNSSRSVSPIEVSPIDERLDVDRYLPSNGANQYPTPESVNQEFRRDVGQQSVPELRTPTMYQSDGISVGYDVSPWSTPESRPTYRDLLDRRTPSRTPSSLRRTTSNSSPAYKRNIGYKKRLSWATRTTEEDKYTEFEMSTQGSERPSFEYSEVRHGPWKGNLGPTAGVAPQRSASDDSQMHKRQQASSDFGSIRAGPYAKEFGIRAPTDQQRSFSEGPGMPVRHEVKLNYSVPQVSRFSWTTVATETTHESQPVNREFTDSPSHLSEPQTVVHSPAEGYSPMQQTPPSPILNRRRPIAVSPHLDGHPALAKTSASRPIKRKPTPSLLPLDATPTGTEKALPTTPSELSTIDYITALDAQLLALANRKHNLLKLIESHQSVTFSPSANPMVVDLEKRRQTKEVVRRLEDELAEVRSKEHETGLKLMKAEKRRDQEAPTALWVRRVHV